MADSYTEALRRSAPQWSLAGDKQLLDVLQGLHQKIIEKCQETNRNLEKMVSALDEASIHLQNVNNKFTALSNSQFIESRVFDDDTEDLSQTEQPKIEPEPKPDEMASIKRSLQILENLHESVTILCDSDSESGTDDDEDIARVVLKPKDLYADRPLPYIIGSRPWKTKWHAGLVADDSDSVSSGSEKRDNLEQYSDSDEPRSESPPHSPQLSSSSELGSEQLPPSNGAAALTTAPLEVRSQSDVAAELARRLGGKQYKIPEPEVIPEAPSPTVRKLYKPQLPTPGIVFLDEPPPLDSEHSDHSDGDIFAELRDNQPYTRRDTGDDLFPRTFVESPPPVNQKQNLFEDESEPELFADKPKPDRETRLEEDKGTKKPIGGKSLFGSNATAESIGAAILKRNQRHSSTSGEESDREPEMVNKINENKNKVVKDNTVNNEEHDYEVKSQKEKERDIFDDLFAKSERINKEKNKNKVVEQKKEPPKPIKKPDLFSDNIFDDIDDIFTTNIKVVTKEEKRAQKSIFDDDDDLFAEVSNNGDNSKIKKTESKNTKDLFNENNDDIFSDKPTEPKKESKVVKETKTSIKETKSIFDDSDDDLFSDVDKPKTIKNVTMSVNTAKNETVTGLLSSTETGNSEKGLFSEDDNLFKNENVTIKTQKPEMISTNSKIKIETSVVQPSKIIKSPDLFEDDDDGLFLFQAQNKQTESNANTESKQTGENQSFDKNSRGIESSYLTKKLPEVVKDKIESASIFSDEDTSDNLFTKRVESKKEVSNENNSVHSNIDKPGRSGALDRFDDDNNLFTNCDKTKTVTIAKPNISEKPVNNNVTVINTQITIKPTVESVTSQDATTTDATVIDTKVIIIPEDTNKTLTTAIETEVVAKPNISQKPTTTKPTSDTGENLTKHANASSVLDNMKEVDANKNITDSIFDDFKSENEPPVETKTDLFSDIFNDQPPVFEKPKEPKRSKNVNALFDDDSDDESLFFKKNDVITDERPEGFVSSDDRLFGLFRDEPPAIDVDFVQKSNKSDRSPKEVISQNINPETSSQNLRKTENVDGKINYKLSSTADDEIFASSDISKSTSVTNATIPDKNSNKEDLFSSVTDDNYFKSGYQSVQDDDDIFSSPKINDVLNQENEVKTDILSQEKPVPEIADNVKAEPKKIGKLKPMNFNINVNSLLPGASPKKSVKSNDKTDGQAPSKSNDDLHSSDSGKDTEFEPKLVKSISFEGSPGSPVLDNKLSKERAKIQVKRKPSTRRARREAVKKSGIDFGDDSTDNSSSIDDQPKHRNLDKNNKTSEKDKTTESELNLEQEEKSIKNKKENLNKDVNTHDKDKFEEDNSQEQRKHEIEENVKDNYEESSILENVKLETNIENTLEQKTIEDKVTHEIEKKTFDQPKDVKSKIVYILNDEDIFDAKVSKIPEIPKPSPANKKNIESGRIFDDSDEIFKGSKIENTKDGIKTLGKVYNEPVAKTQKLDFFSDSDDDNLFKTSKTTKEVSSVQKKVKTEEKVNVVVKDVPLKSKSKISIFDDTNDDLFKAKTEENIVKNEKKVSLFGSDSDEELFGGSNKVKEVFKKDEFKKEEIKRDFKKGSLFGDDDDGDLFGASDKKKNDTKPHSSKPTASKDMVSKSAEPVFEDPLSLLGSDDE